MKANPILFILTGLVAHAGGWGYSIEPSTPTAAYIEFHKLIVAGEADQSWGMLSHETQESIARLTEAQVQVKAGMDKVSSNPVCSKLFMELLNSMHIKGVITDATVWKALIAEAAESDDLAYLSPELQITAELVAGDRARLTLDYGNITLNEGLVLEDGVWKVQYPHVLTLGLRGWQADLADHYARVSALAEMARSSGVNRHKSDDSVRTIVRKEK